MSDRLRIGNAQAFWGDRTDAAAELLGREPDLDYLTLDYLAEVSMSILALQRERDPQAGYAGDFVEVVRSLAPYWAAGGRCRVITNAGGLSPAGCAAACAAVLAECGCPPLKIAVVTGDDVLSQLLAAAEDPAADRFRHLDSGRPLSDVRDRLTTANAYLGAAPIVEALAQGAQIIITGRVADPSLVVAPCRHHFRWNERDWDRLAGATIAGHLIECGTQVTGGLWTDWLSLPDPAHLGFPIVEVSADGSCVVTKPRGTGGRVNAGIVKEQLLYEIGDPDRYLSPDATVSFLSLSVEEVGQDRVRVRGARGAPPPDTLKVSATYRDGYRAAGMLTLCGREAAAKGRRCGEIILQRLREAGHELRDSVIECLGTGEFAGGRLAGATERELVETVLRVAVESPSRAAVEQFTRELMPLITAGPPGTTGYAEGRPRVHPVFRYWPCLIERSRVPWRVDGVESPPPAGPAPLSQRPMIAPTRKPALSADLSGAETPAPSWHHSPSSVPPATSGTLRDLACARSGDKGTNANIGVLTRRVEDYPRLCGWLTAERVAEFFRPLGVERVDRYELPNLHALNFVLHGILRRSLRTDAQGKALAQALLDLPLLPE
jgi:hypothetical protein